MAKLIDPSATERPVPRLVGGAHAPMPGAPIDEAGRGMVQLGADLGRAGEELFHAQRIEEDRVNTLRAEDAFTQLRERQLDLSIGDQGFTKRRGVDAVSQPLLTEYGKRFDDVEGQIAAGLNNDQQRQRFKQRANVSRLQFNEEILRHLAREGDTYAKEVFDGTLMTEQRNAVARWDSPNDIQISLERIKEAVHERGDRYGWNAQYRDAVLQQETGKIHAAVIGQAIASGGYKYGEQWFKDHRADIDLATAKTLEKAVEDGTQKELSNGYNSEYLANEDSQGALEGLRKRVLADQGLDEVRRNVLVGRIQNRQYVLERRDELDRNRVLRTLERGINELNANTLAGFEPNAEQFSPYIAATKGTELEGDLQRAIALATATRSFRNQLPVVQERLLAESEAGVRTEPTKFDRKVVSAWRSIYNAQQQQAKDNPVSFAVQQGVIEPPQPLDLVAPYKAGPAFAERFAIARAVAGTYNVPVKPLTDQETNLLRAVLKGAPAQEKSQYFAGLAQAAGNDYEGYSAVMAQLAPDEPVTAIAGTYAYRGRTIASDLMLRGQGILNPVRKEDGKPDQGKLWPMPPEADLRKGFQSYERDAFAGHPAARSAMYQAALAIYAAKSADEGDASAVINSSRWEDAIHLATGGIEKYKGKGTVLPYGYEYGQFVDGLRARIDTLAEQGRLPDGVTRATLEGLPLEAVGDGRYIFRAGNGVMVDPQNRPLVVDFNVGLPFRSSGQGQQDLANPPTAAELELARQPARRSLPGKKGASVGPLADTSTTAPKETLVEKAMRLWQEGVHRQYPAPPPKEGGPPKRGLLG